MKKTLFVTLVIISVSILSACKAQESPFPKPLTATQQPEIKILLQTSDVVWGFDFIETNKILFTERAGAMKILDVSSGVSQTVQHVPEVAQYGQGGLLDVALHPDFAKTKWVYFSYAVKVDNFYETRIARAKLQDLKLQDLQILFTSNAKSTAGEHFGSRIVFDRNGHIFFSVGDRGQRENAQNLTVASGKIFRLTEDGKIPTDNPFVKQKNAIGAIWSYGHRNPQGLYYDLSTKTLWEQEHGPKGGDEINLIQKGKNYGWPVITYGREYSGPTIGTTHKEDMEQPVYYFIPSIAPSGLAVYKGNIYSGALALTHLNRLVMDGTKVLREERLLENKHERVRNVKVGPDNLLYISTDSGKIIQLKL